MSCLYNYKNQSYTKEKLVLEIASNPLNLNNRLSLNLDAISKAVDENKESKVFFHGTNTLWEVFSPKTAEKLSVGLRNQLYLTPEPDFAEDYVGIDKETGKAGGTLSLFAKVTKPFDYENPADIEAMQLDAPNGRAYAEDLNEFPTANWMVLEEPAIQAWFKKKGYDGFYVKEQGIKNLAVYNPNQVKSAANDNVEISDNDNIKYQRQNTVARGAAQIAEDGKAIIYAITNPNVSTPLHELAHVWEHYLIDEERQSILRWTGQDSIVDGGPAEWTRDTSEQFARGFEKYLTDGNANDSNLQILFDRFKQWLTDIYKGIFGTQIDIGLNEPMKKIYSDMLGTNYREKTLQEINEENDKRTDVEKRIEVIQRQEATSNDFTQPISPDSTYYWSHLSTIQQAFINKKYDKLLLDNKINEEQLNKIVNSTNSITYGNAGLSLDLVKQAIFRINNQDLISDSKYWTSYPTIAEELDSYKRTVREIATDGSLKNAIQNNVISPENGQKILTHAGQVAPDVYAVIKTKLEENTGLEEQTQIAEQNSVNEDVEIPPLVQENELNKALEQTNLPEVQPNEFQQKDIRKRAKKGTDIYNSMLSKTTTQDEFNEVMRAIAEQLNDVGSRDSMLKTVGDYIANIATEMYPNVTVAGDDLLLKIQDSENDIADEELEEIPSQSNDDSILQGDTVDFKGTLLTVDEIVYGETPDDNLYFLSDGGMKYKSQLIKVSDQALYSENYRTYNETAPNIFEDIDEELTNETDPNQKALNYAGLKTLLERLKVKFNNTINYQIVETNEDFIGRFKNGVVEINLAKYDKSTPFHEYLHPFIEVLKGDNPELYRNLALELSENEEGRKIIDEVKNSAAYSALSAQEIGDEALVRYISNKAAENVNQEGRRIKDQYNSKLDKLISKFRDWFSRLWSKLGGMVVDNLGKIPLTATLEDIADMVSLHDLKFDLSYRKELTDKLEKYQEDVEPEKLTYEQLILKKVKENLSILENTAKQRLNSDVLLTEVIKLRSIFKDSDEVTSLQGYMMEGFHALEDASRDFNTIANKLKAATGNLSEEELQQMSKDLAVIKTIIPFYKEAEDYFTRSAAKDLSDSDYRFYKEILDKKTELLNRMQTVSADIATEWLFPKVDQINDRIKEKYPDKVLTRDKFRDLLYTAGGDVDQAFFLLGAVGNSKDPVSAIVRSAIYNMVEQNHFYETETLEDIKIKYDKFLTSNGLQNSKSETADYYKKNYLRKATSRIQTGLDDLKNPKFEYVNNWAFVQEFNYDLFDKARTDFMEDVNEFSPSGFDETNAKHITKLRTWETQNGTNVQIGTKQEAKNIYESEERNAKKIGEEWVEVPIYKLQPNDNYRNAQYENIKNDPFYQSLTKHYSEGNEKLGENKLQYGIVPQVSKGKNMFLDYKDKTAQEKLKIFGNKLLNTPGNALSYTLVPKAGEESTSAENSVNLDGTTYRNIGTEYNRLIAEQDLDLTLPETVAKFASSSNLSTLKNATAPLVEVTKSLIEGNKDLNIKARKILKVTNDNKTIFDKFLKKPVDNEKENKKLNKQLVNFINDVMYGETADPTVLNIKIPVIENWKLKVKDRAVSLDKLGRNWSFLTALSNMAVNIGGAFSNAAVGNAQLFIESTGGRYFKGTDWRKAEGQYFKSIPDFTKDGFRLQKSLITQLGIKYDAIQGEFRDNFGKKFVGNLADRYANGDTLFFTNHIAEHQIQLTGMLAYMNATKVKTADGQEIPLFDAHYLNKDGYLRLKDGIQWTKQNEIDFINSWHGINKRLNGNYSSFDKALLQRKWYGKLALVYRKFIYTSIRNRFTKEYTDYELGNVDFGYQRKFFGKFASDIKTYKFGVAQRYFNGKAKQDWSEDEKYAASKTLTELGLVTGMFILAGAIAKAEAGDDDAGWGGKTALLYTLRFKNDLALFTIAGIPDIARIAQNPSAIMVTMSKYYDFFHQLATDPTDTYSRKTGVFEKGTLKLEAKFLKALPVVRQAINLLSPDQQLAYYNVLKDK